MLPKHLIEELKDEFKENAFLSKMIIKYFEEKSSNLRPLIDSFVEEILNEISES